MPDKKKHPLWIVIDALRGLDHEENYDLDKTILGFESHEEAEDRRSKRQDNIEQVLEKIRKDEEDAEE